MKQWLHKRWPLLLGLLCIAVLLCLWFCSRPTPSGYSLPFDPEEIDSVCFYASSGGWGLKKQVTRETDILQIVNELESMYKKLSITPYEVPIGNHVSHIVFYLENGEYFVCSISEGGRAYFSDGTTKMQISGTSWEGLWNSLDYPEEPGYPHWDNISTPAIF